MQSSQTPMTVTSASFRSAPRGLVLSLRWRFCTVARRFSNRLRRLRRRLAPCIPAQVSLQGLSMQELTYLSAIDASKIGTNAIP